MCLLQVGRWYMNMAAWVRAPTDHGTRAHSKTPKEKKKLVTPDINWIEFYYIDWVIVVRR